MLPSFAEYFQQQELSDADIVIRLRPEAGYDPPSKRRRLESDSQQLAKFPCHQIIVFTCDYFKYQVRHWQPSTPGNGRTTRSSSTKASTSGAAAQRPTLELTIDSAEHLSAAKAVIAAMYGVDNALGSLEQPQLVHAVVIADRVQVAVATQQAVQALLAAAKSEQGLSAAALDTLASLCPWPSCLLLPLLPAVVEHARCCDDSFLSDLPAIQAADNNSRVQRMLVAALGDLDAVWREQQLQELLLQLPLPAMQLLLSSDQLRVASEDTVLYTVSRYAKEQHLGHTLSVTARIAAKLAARSALAPLVRCPHLSRFALSYVALSTGNQQLLQHSLGKQLTQLLALKHSAVQDLSPHDYSQLSGAPGSWQLGQRQVMAAAAANGASVVWRLPVEQLKQACRDSFVKQQRVDLYGPPSPPFGGLAWLLQLVCQQEEEGGAGGTQIGLFAGAVDPPLGVLHKFQATLRLGDIKRCVRGSSWITSGTRGHHDFCGLSPMAGGWDEAVWAAKGLPTTGEVELELQMHSLC